MDIVFVMLHYMAIEETKISIDYIRKNVDTEKYKIIVVDNENFISATFSFFIDSEYGLLFNIFSNSFKGFFTVLFSWR